MNDLERLLEYLPEQHWSQEIVAVHLKGDEAREQELWDTTTAAAEEIARLEAELERLCSDMTADRSVLRRQAAELTTLREENGRVMNVAQKLTAEKNEMQAELAAEKQRADENGYMALARDRELAEFREAVSLVPWAYLPERLRQLIEEKP